MRAATIRSTSNPIWRFLYHLPFSTEFRSVQARSFPHQKGVSTLCSHTTQGSVDTIGMKQHQFKQQLRCAAAIAAPVGAFHSVKYHTSLPTLFRTQARTHALASIFNTSGKCCHCLPDWSIHKHSERLSLQRFCCTARCVQV